MNIVIRRDDLETECITICAECGATYPENPKSPTKEEEPMTTAEKIKAYGEYEEGVPNLSPAQVERQDFVDNETFNFIHALIPDGKGVVWDISFIHEVWEVVQDELIKRGVCTEMEFYPYIEVPQDTCQHEFEPKNNDGLEECRICFLQRKG